MPWVLFSQEPAAFELLDMHAEHSGSLDKLKLGWGGLNCCCCKNTWSTRFAVLKGGFLFVFRSQLVRIYTIIYILRGNFAGDILENVELFLFLENERRVVS